MTTPTVAVADDSHRRITRQTLWTGAVTAVEVLGAFVHIFVAARLLGLEGYGALAVIIATTTLVHGLIAIPGGDTVTTFATRSIADGRRKEASSILRFAVSVSLGLALVAYGVIATLTLTVSGLLRIDEAHTGAMLLYGIVGILLATRSEALAVLRLADRLRAHLGVSVADNATRVAVLAMAWFAGGDLLTVVSATVAGAAVGTVGMLLGAAIFAGQAGFAGLFRSPSIRVPADVIGFHVGTYGRTTIGVVTGNVDTILVAQFAGPADVGLYRAARRIMDMARRPFHLIRTSVQPELSRQWYSGQGEALRRTLFRFGTYSLALAIVGFTVLGVFREPIAVLVLGSAFVEVSPLLLILIPGAFIASAAVVGGLPIATGHVWPSIISMLGGLVVSVVGIVWLVPLYLSDGAAWARTASSIAAVLVLVPFVVELWRQSHRI